MRRNVYRPNANILNTVTKAIRLNRLMYTVYVAVFILGLSCISIYLVCFILIPLQYARVMPINPSMVILIIRFNCINSINIYTSLGGQFRGPRIIMEQPDVYALSHNEPLAFTLSHFNTILL